MNIRDFGAKGDGQTVDTVAIQEALDACAAQGGGTAWFPAGSYVTGTLRLRSHVTLQLDSAAVLVGSTSIADYATDTHWQRYDGESHMDRCLLYAEGCEGVGLLGPGTIDGRGHAFPAAGSNQRPMLMRFLNCRDVRLRDLQLRRPASWTAAFIRCEAVRADSLSIVSRANDNGDGLDFDSCQNVSVANCTFDTSDDAICLQNSEKERACRNIVVQNCIMVSRYAAIRIGMLSSGDIEDVTVSNCIFRDTECSGLKIQSAEGGRLRRMLFSSLLMHNVPRPIFMTLNQFHMGLDAPAEPPPTGEISDILFADILATCDDVPDSFADPSITIAGTPGLPIERISLSNVRVCSAGGGAVAAEAAASSNHIPEFSGQRPEPQVLAGRAPAYGLYARHVHGLSLEGVHFTALRPDSRQAVVLDDATLAAGTTAGKAEA